MKNKIITVLLLAGAGFGQVQGSEGYVIQSKKVTWADPLSTTKIIPSIEEAIEEEEIERLAEGEVVVVAPIAQPQASIKIASPIMHRPIAVRYLPTKPTM